MSTGKRVHEKAGFVGTPVLTIPLLTWQTMMAYVHACPIEVNGFGYVQRTGPLEFRVDDVFLLEQEATMVSVNVQEGVLHRHLLEMVREGRSTGDMRFQWHSHVHMDAYFSGTDLANIENYGQGWMLSLVVNKYGEFEARLDMFEPFRAWSPVSVRIEIDAPADLALHAQQEIRDKVRTTPVFLRPAKVKPDTRTPLPQLTDAEMLGEGR